MYFTSFFMYISTQNIVYIYILWYNEKDVK